MCPESGFSPASGWSWPGGHCHCHLPPALQHRAVLSLASHVTDNCSHYSSYWSCQGSLTLIICVRWSSFSKSPGHDPQPSVWWLCKSHGRDSRTAVSCWSACVHRLPLEMPVPLSSASWNELCCKHHLSVRLNFFKSIRAHTRVHMSIIFFNFNLNCSHSAQTLPSSICFK